MQKYLASCPALNKRLLVSLGCSGEPITGLIKFFSQDLISYQTEATPRSRLSLSHLGSLVYYCLHFSQTDEWLSFKPFLPSGLTLVPSSLNS